MLSASNLTMDSSTILSSCNILCQKIILIFRQLQRRITRNFSCNFTRIPRLFGENRNISRSDENENTTNNGTLSVRVNSNNNQNNNNNNNINNSNNSIVNNNNNNRNHNNNNNNNNNINTLVATSPQNVNLINSLSTCKNYLISSVVKMLFFSKNQMTLSIKIIFGFVKNSNVELRKVIIYILRIIRLIR